MSDESEHERDHDDFEDSPGEPLPAEFAFVDRAAQKLVRTEWIGHPPVTVPPLSTAELKALSDICLKLKQSGRFPALGEWMTGRMYKEAESGGKLEPVGGRIYGLMMLMVVLRTAGIEPFASTDIHGCRDSSRKPYVGPAVPCEATESEAAECALPTDNPDRPYLLSHAAADRLEHYCLSPVEWYRLVILHGRHLYNLLDHFYGDEGEPYQPTFPVIRTPRDGVPKCADVRHDLRQLMDFILFKLQLDQEFQDKPEVMGALAAFGREAVERELDARLAYQSATYMSWAVWNIRVELGYVDERRLRLRWSDMAGKAEALCTGVSDMARDSVLIIGSAATIDLVLEAADQLSHLPAKHGERQFLRPWDIAYALRDRMGADMLLELVLVLMDRVSGDRLDRVGDGLMGFYLFRDKRAVDWIEQHAREPIGHQWGAAAAINGMSWERVKRWLERGRPLSLVALDAMQNCREYDKETMAGVFEKNSPKIGGRPTHGEVSQVLVDYARRDPDQRVTNAMAVILANLKTILSE